MFNNLRKPFILVVCLFISGSVHAGKWVNWEKVTSDVSDAAHAGIDAVSNGVETVVDTGRAAVDTVVEAGKDIKDSVVEKKINMLSKELRKTLLNKQISIIDID